MDFDQDLEGLVYTGQGIIVRQKALEFAFPNIKTLKNQGGWFRYWKESKEWRFASLPEVYDAMKSPGMQAGGRRRFLDALKTGIMTSTRIIYGKSAAEKDTIIHNYRQKNELRIECRVPALMEDSFMLDEITQLEGFLKYTRSLLKTDDSAEEIIKTLESHNAGDDLETLSSEMPRIAIDPLEARHNIRAIAIDNLFGMKISQSYTLEDQYFASIGVRP